MESESETPIPDIPDDRYNMAAILKAECDINETTLCVPDYEGPFAIEKIDGKGRGIIATQNILPGQLIIASKALAIVFPENNVSTNCQIPISTQEVGLSNLEKAVTSLVQKSSEIASKIYNLYAGPKLKWIELSDYPLEGRVDNHEIDAAKRIHRICLLNGFQCDSPVFHGLWYLPAFLNHDCYRSNAHWRVYKNLMLVRAAKFIPIGDEVLITYFDSNQPFCERRKLFSKHGLKCNCLLCDLEWSEGPIVRNNRDNILKRFSIKIEKSVDFVESCISDLESLRPTNPELNIFLFQPLVQLGLCYYERGEWEKSAEAIGRVMDLCELSTPFSLAGSSAAMTIATCYLRLGKSKAEVKKWVEISKTYILVQYGTLNVLDIIRPSFVKEMKSAGFSL